MSAAGPASLPELRRQAIDLWRLRGGARLRSFIGTGQCTDWATRMRPDVLEAVFIARTIAADRGAPQEHLGYAKVWPRVARWAGMTVRDVPVAGALVVWQPGVQGADLGTGHIGFVTRVSAHGTTFSTSAMNVGGLYRMGYRTLSATPVPGRSFIYPSQPGTPSYRYVQPDGTRWTPQLSRTRRPSR